ncbi:hypothetical protein NN561_008381 [Cricetulus griseus]
MPVGSRREGEPRGGSGCQRVPSSTAARDEGHECPGGTVGRCVPGSPAGAIARFLQVGALVAPPRPPAPECLAAPLCALGTYDLSRHRALEALSCRPGSLRASP